MDERLARDWKHAVRMNNVTYCEGDPKSEQGEDTNFAATKLARKVDDHVIRLLDSL